MTVEIALLLAIIALTVVAFVREWMTIDVIALTSLGLLVACRLVTPEQAVAGFSNPAVITVMMMFILSESLVASGLVSKIGYKIADLTGPSATQAAVLLLVMTGVLSAIVNNTAAVSVLMPVAIHLARHYKLSPSKLLLPLSYTAIFGGTCTLLGTSTNLLVSSLSEQHGGGAFSVFEFLSLGAVLFAVGLVYNVLVPMRWLEPRRVPDSLTGKYHLRGYLTELKLPADSPLIGRTVLSEQISGRFDMNVLEILRGDERIASDLRNTTLELDDVLLVRGAMEDIVAFKEQNRLLLLTDVKLDDKDLNDQHTILAELQVTPGSSLIGSNLKEVDFRRKFGCFVLALSRTGETIREKLAWIALKPWDILLVFGTRARVERLYSSEEFLPIGERSIKLRLARRWWIDPAVIAVAVGMAAFGVMSILEASILGVVALLVTRRLTMQQAYRGIDWTVIFLLAAILPLGTAIENTGLDVFISRYLSVVGVQLGPVGLLSVLYLATGLLTSFFSNNATAVLMVPIALKTAGVLGIDAKPLLMAVAYAASASFMTPMGYQTNAMVLGPGNYRFTDYLKFGAPLNLIFWALASWLIPVFWPFGG